MSTKKIMVNIDADLKERFMRGCESRMLNASAVIRHCITEKVKEFELNQRFND